MYLPPTPFKNPRGAQVKTISVTCELSTCIVVDDNDDWRTTLGVALRDQAMLVCADLTEDDVDITHEDSNRSSETGAEGDPPF
jgi:hypothetical protein